MTSDMTGFGATVGAIRDPEFVQTLDSINRNRIFENLTDVAYREFEASLGDHVLDVGCGTGEVLAKLSSVVGKSGRVVGLDSNQSMLAEVRSRLGGLDPAPGSVLGRCECMPFKDEEFDRVRAERVLIYSTEMHSAISEMIRVTKPGGRVLIAEPDLATSIPASGKRQLTRRILQYSQDSHGASDVARSAHKVLLSAGMENVNIVPVVSLLREYPIWFQAFRIEAMLERQVNEGVVTEEEASDWLRDLEVSGVNGSFFWSVTSFVVTGDKPLR